MGKNQNQPIINFEKVSKRYPGGITALNDITFSIDPGEFTFLVGPSGAGKSTVIRLLIKQEAPTEGEIHFEDINVTSIPRKLLSMYRQQLGVIFQDLKLIDSKNVKENIQFALEITDRKTEEIEETTNYLLDIVNLKGRAHLFPIELSGGERQRVAIARALANDPKLLIADEPTGNLDQENAEEIMSILDAINNWGTTVMVITHDSNIVERMKRRVLQLNQGSIVADIKGSQKTESKKTLKKPSFLSRENKDIKANDENSEGKRDGYSDEEVKSDNDVSNIIEELKKKDRKLVKKMRKDGYSDIESILDKTEQELIDQGYKKKQLDLIEDIVHNYYSKDEKSKKTG